MAINLDTIKSFVPIVLPIIKGIIGKTNSKIDDAALQLVIAILEELVFKADIDGE